MLASNTILKNASSYKSRHFPLPLNPLQATNRENFSNFLCILGFDAEWIRDCQQTRSHGEALFDAGK